MKKNKKIYIYMGNAFVNELKGSRLVVPTFEKLQKLVIFGTV